MNGLPPGQSVPSGFSLRRARLELAGEFFELSQWQLGAEFAPSNSSTRATTRARRSTATRSRRSPSAWGSSRPFHVDLDRPQQPARHGVQALVRFEQLALSYTGSSRGGTNDARTPTVSELHEVSTRFGVQF